MSETPKQIEERRLRAEVGVEKILIEEKCRLAIEETMIDGQLVGRKVIVLPMQGSEEG